MQRFVKEIIVHIYELGYSHNVYLSIELVAAIVSIAFCVWFGKKIGIGAGKVLLAECIGIVSVFIEMAVFRATIAWIIKDSIPVMNSYFQNVGRTVILILFRTFWVSKLLRLDYKKLSSVFALTQAITWGISCFACFFPGCCNGYPWKYGVYNVRMEDYVFPTQLINAVALVLIVIITVRKIQKNNYVVADEVAPIIMILIGVTRFITEFLMDNSKIVLGLSSLSFDALVMCLVGTIALVVMRKRNDRIIVQN